MIPSRCRVTSPAGLLPGGSPSRFPTSVPLCVMLKGARLGLLPRRTSANDRSENVRCAPDERGVKRAARSSWIPPWSIRAGAARAGCGTSEDQYS